MEKNNKVVETVREKPAPWCVKKKEGESGLEQILNFRLVLSSFYTNCITGTAK